MASGVNKVILVGNLGNDPELKHTPSGMTVCEFRLATNESWTDKNGQKQDRTEWHRVVVWGKRAEVCGKYLSKGKQVFVDGKLRTRSWEDKEGNKKYMTEIQANDIQFLSGGTGGPSKSGGGAGDEAPPPPDYSFGAPDDDIPF